MTNNNNTPADKVLAEIQIRLKCSKDKIELALLKSILLSVGVLNLTNNSKDNTFAIRSNE